MHLELSLSAGGPKVPHLPADEMQEQDLRNAMAYLHSALSIALRQGLDEAVVDVLRDWYDESFIALAGISERFREKVLSGRVLFPEGLSVRSRYVAFVKEASES